MAERDLQDIKNEIKGRDLIVEVVSGYTTLKKAGAKWKGLCPFHQEKSPSFEVSQQFQSYRCWSCGEKGDIFDFVEKKENLTFIEALESLAKRAGIPFERQAVSPERASERQQMLELNALAVKFFRDRLTKSVDAQEYLTRRGILRSTQEQFDIGYAAPDSGAMAYYLQRSRADLGLAAKVGLVYAPKFEGGNYNDVYRNRMMFPIHDLNGNVVGFGGRTLEDDPRKYINSPASDIFDKSRTLYGLYFARKKLSGEVPAVFVEGYMDVVTTHQAGFTQCVATLGTAMTEQHAVMLNRYNRRVVLCYDSDRAGISATLKGAAIWESVGAEGSEMRVARLPAGEDPDSLLKRGDTAAFQLALDHAIPRVDFEIELAQERHDLGTEEGRDAALREIIPILASVRGRTSLDRYVQRMAKLHPMYHFSVSRALESILADVQTYVQQTKNRTTSRANGHAGVEEQNGMPLQEQTGPPRYVPPGRDQWGNFDPGTRYVIRGGEKGSQGGGNYRDRGKWKDRQGPASDPTPPSLALPPLSRAEKAERRLLRAMFTPELRAYILGRLHPGFLISVQAQTLFQWIAQTPANEDGGIDPVLMFRRAEREESGPISASESAAEKVGVSGSGIEVPTQSKFFAKMSDFIRDIVEDSASVLSNEPLNEAAVSGWIQCLQEYRDELTKRQLLELLERDDLTAEQRLAYTVKHTELLRAKRGTPPDK